MVELDKCYYNDGGSFLNQLFYEAVFDRKIVDALCHEIVNTVKKNNQENLNVDLEVVKKSIFVTTKFSQAVISHFDPNDSFMIKK